MIVARCLIQDLDLVAFVIDDHGSFKPGNVRLAECDLRDGIFPRAVVTSFRRRLPAGSVLGAYLVGYGVARFVIEFFRGDPDRGFVLGGMLSTSQAIAAVMVPVGIGILVWARRHAKREQPVG